MVVNNAVLTQDNLTQENLLQEELTKEASSNDELTILREMKEKKPEFSSRMYPDSNPNSWRAFWLFLAPFIIVISSICCIASKTTIVPPLIFVSLTALVTLGMFRDVIQYRYFRRTAPAYYATVVDVLKPVLTDSGRSNPAGAPKKGTLFQNPAGIEKIDFNPKMKALVSKNGCGVLAEFRVPEYVNSVMYPLGTKVVVQMLGNDAILCETAAGEAVHPMTDVRERQRYDLQKNAELLQKLRTQTPSTAVEVLPLSMARTEHGGILFVLLLLSVRIFVVMRDEGALSGTATLALSLSTIPVFALWMLLSRTMFFRRAREYNATVVSVNTEYRKEKKAGTEEYVWHHETKMKALVYMADREALVSFLVEDGISELTHPAGTLVRVRVLKGKYVLIRK
ncbi:MAG: hypothetical protein J5628_02755 [Lachnospiraceae bacterium]|nr:hypothetical protein [Lachnospiraceae bacterium]